MTKVNTIINRRESWDMRIKGYLIEYNLLEAARILRISPRHLRDGVQKGTFKYFYCLDGREYTFHDASIDSNRQVLMSESARG